jgi:hypothetical protein
MTAVRRRLLNVLAALSQLLCGATVVMWARSYSIDESLSFGLWIEARTADNPDHHAWLEGWKKVWSADRADG